MSYKTSMLVVNENQDLLNNYKAFFDKHDYKVFCTTDSKAVLEVIAKNKIAFIHFRARTFAQYLGYSGI